LSIDPDELLWCSGPGGQLHVVDKGSVVQLPQLVVAGVTEHLVQVEELRDQFLKINQKY